MALIVVTCGCGTDVRLNPKKHKYRPKYCPQCRDEVAPRSQIYLGNKWWEIAKYAAKEIKARYFRRHKPVTMTDEQIYQMRIASQLVTYTFLTAAIIKRRQKQY